MVENGKIHLTCKCGNFLDYLARRYTNYLAPKCPRCSGIMRPDQADMVAEAGVCYKAPKEKTPCVRSC